MNHEVLVRACLISATLAVAGSASAQYPSVDERILQASARQVTGFGLGRGYPHAGFVNDAGIRGDFLWGLPGDEHFRYGPAFDVRSANFSTIELGAGGSVLIPFRRGYPIQLTPAVGYAFRKRDFGGDGFYLSNTFSWGYRPYNYFHHRYGYGIMAFASHRMHLDDPSQWELTFGIEFDLELAIWVPILMVRMALQDNDPDEPVEDPEAPDVGGATSGQTAD